MATVPARVHQLAMDGRPHPQHSSKRARTKLHCCCNPLPTLSPRRARPSRRRQGQARMTPPLHTMPCLPLLLATRTPTDYLRSLLDLRHRPTHYLRSPLDPQHRPRRLNRLNRLNRPRAIASVRRGVQLLRLPTPARAYLQSRCTRRAPQSVTTLTTRPLQSSCGRWRQHPRALLARVIRARLTLVLGRLPRP